MIVMNHALDKTIGANWSPACLANVWKHQIILRNVQTGVTMMRAHQPKKLHSPDPSSVCKNDEENDADIGHNKISKARNPCLRWWKVSDNVK